MRPFLSLIAAMSMAATSASALESRCTSPRDQQAFDVGALKSELSVLAVGCSNEDGYNRFVEHYRANLVAEDRVVNEWFKKTYGRNAQREYDAYITLLANQQSQQGIHEASDFCPRLKPLFTEVMALPDAAALPQYAAAKDLIPSDMAACETAIAAKPAAAGSRSRSSAKPATHHK